MNEQELGTVPGVESAQDLGLHREHWLTDGWRGEAGGKAGSTVPSGLWSQAQCARVMPGQVGTHTSVPRGAVYLSKLQGL